MRSVHIGPSLMLQGGQRTELLGQAASRHHINMTIYMLAVHLFGLFALAQSSTRQVGLANKVLLFPQPTDFSYATLMPLKPMALRAFTLCLRVATEPPEERDIILFAYRTTDYDELNVWREKDGRVSLYMSGDGVFFFLPPLSTFRTSLCLTWESVAGLSAFWVDGKRSVHQVYKPGHSIRHGGTVLVGQDPDKHLGGFEATQSFVGEMTDVNMWDYVLSRNVIEAWHNGNMVPKGNIFDWATIDYQLNGNVILVDDA
ncbi:C-reactive protein-like isoform X1 [Stigmatopora nigra]